VLGSLPSIDATQSRVPRWDTRTILYSIRTVGRRPCTIAAVIGAQILHAERQLG
jgi:hypothetical protein